MLAVTYEGRIIGIKDKNDQWKPIDEYTMADVQFALANGEIIDIYQEEEKILIAFLLLLGVFLVIAIIIYFSI